MNGKHCFLAAQSILQLGFAEWLRANGSLAQDSGLPARNGGAFSRWDGKEAGWSVLRGLDLRVEAPGG
jgi:hypothetical protein